MGSHCHCCVLWAVELGTAPGNSSLVRATLGALTRSGLGAGFIWGDDRSERSGKESSKLSEDLALGLLSLQSTQSSSTSLKEEEHSTWMNVCFNCTQCPV